MERASAGGQGAHAAGSCSRVFRRHQVLPRMPPPVGGEGKWPEGDARETRVGETQAGGASRGASRHYRGCSPPGSVPSAPALRGSVLPVAPELQVLPEPGSTAVPRRGQSCPVCDGAASTAPSSGCSMLCHVLCRGCTQVYIFSFSMARRMEPHSLSKGARLPAVLPLLASRSAGWLRHGLSFHYSLCILYGGK